MHHPGFSCPLCRTFADLEADVETEEDHELEEEAMRADGSDSDPEPETAVQLPEEDQVSEEVLASPSRPAVSSSRRSSMQSRVRTPSNPEIPDSGQFQFDIRRASISISGPQGDTHSLPITGRSSRPSSVRNLDMSTRSITPMTSTSALRDQPDSHFMSQANTAVNNSRIHDDELGSLQGTRPNDFASSVDEGLSELSNGRSTADEDDTLFLSNQTPANSSFLSSIPSTTRQLDGA